MIKLLIADDHQLFIEGIYSLLQNQAQIQLMGHAFDGKGVMEELRRKEVDVLLLDLKMPDTDIRELIWDIRTRFPAIRIIILTMYYGSDYYQELLHMGIRGVSVQKYGKGGADQRHRKRVCRQGGDGGRIRL